MIGLKSCLAVAMASAFGAAAAAQQGPAAASYTAQQAAAGGIAFVGDLDRNFKAVDVRTGAILWQVRLGTSVQGFPLTFSIDGKQYIAVTTGLGGGSPRNVPSIIATDIRHPMSGNALYVFALPDRN